MSTSTVELSASLQPKTAVRAKTSIIFLGFLIVSFAILYHNVIASLIADWYTDENYSHGFLVIPLALYFAWERRRQFLDAARRPSAFGLVTVLGSLFLLVVGVLGTEYFTARVSMVGVIAGSILFLYGWQHLKVMLFPIAFLLLMIPLPEIVFNQITLPLQFFASAAAENTLGLLHIPVFREGNVIHLSNVTLEVADACSGIRSLISLLTLGIAYGYFRDSRQSIRLLLMASTIPIAILTNAARVAGTGAAAYRFGPQVAEGFLHSFSGWLMFIAACILLVLFHVLLGWLFRWRKVGAI